ncbi:MAG TPA: hypothetical protein VGS19_31015 [Streptosporangiaceae bacterium]|nr:hypothetical protein [Streptosporangiaceae bacterium]
MNVTAAAVPGTGVLQLSSMDVAVPAGRLVFAWSPAGDPIAECQLDATETSMAGVLAEAASRGGARLLWVHCTADLSGAGFSRRPGYRKLTVDAVPPGDPLPVLDTATVLDLWPRAFIRQWGHHRIGPDVEIPPGGSFLGLRAGASWAGLCRAEPDQRHIDGPGFVPGSGSPDAARRLVLGACAYLGPGPATLETWGDPAEYEAIGFQTIEECGGWELALTR